MTTRIGSCGHRPNGASCGVISIEKPVKDEVSIIVESLCISKVMVNRVAVRLATPPKVSDAMKVMRPKVGLSIADRMLLL